MPRGCKPTGEHALSNAERQVRYRARSAGDDALQYVGEPCHRIATPFNFAVWINVMAIDQ